MNEFKEDYSIKDFPMKSKWYTGDWFKFFEK